MTKSSFGNTCYCFQWSKANLAHVVRLEDVFAWCYTDVVLLVLTQCATVSTSSLTWHFFVIYEMNCCTLKSYSWFMLQFSRCKTRTFFHFHASFMYLSVLLHLAASGLYSLLSQPTSTRLTPTLLEFRYCYCALKAWL